MLTCRKS